MDFEREQLKKMQNDFEIIFHAKLEENDVLKQIYAKIEAQDNEMKSQFLVKESEMKERWKKDVDEIADENREIEEAWNDLREQEKEYEECLKSETLTEKDRSDIELEIEQLQEAKNLLKIEEEKVATKERKILDAIEVEMDRWEQYKQSEDDDILERKKNLAKEIGSSDLNSLSNKMAEKEASIGEMVLDLKKQDSVLKDFEADIEERKAIFLSEKDEILKEKETLNDSMCKSVIKFEQEIIAINEELNDVDEKLNNDLQEIQEERERYTDLFTSIHHCCIWQC